MSKDEWNRCVRSRYIRPNAVHKQLNQTIVAVGNRCVIAQRMPFSNDKYLVCEFMGTKRTGFQMNKKHIESIM